MRREAVRGFLQVWFIGWFVLAASVALSASPAAAQLGASCTATVQNRTVQANGDGSFFIPNVPSEQGLYRARVSCGGGAEGESPLFQFVPNGDTVVSDIDFTSLTPLPEALQVEVFPEAITRRGGGATIVVTGILSDGSGVDMSDVTGGTEYWVSDPRLARLEFESGAWRLIAQDRGRVLVGARRNGLLGHGTEFRRGDKLGPKFTADKLVVGLRIIVGAVIGVAPLVDAVGSWFDEFAIADESGGRRSQRAQQFGVCDLFGRGGRHDNAIGHVVGKVHRCQRAGAHEHARS